MTHHGGHNNCDAACQKLILDFAMALAAALFYLRVLARTDGLTNADYETPQFFIDAEKAFLETALWLNDNRKLITDEQFATMMGIADENCYRAGYLTNWASMPSITPDKAAAWTNKLLGWVKSDQDFFVPLVKGLIDLGHKHDHDHDHDPDHDPDKE